MKTQDPLIITGVPDSIAYGDNSFMLSTTGGDRSSAIIYAVKSGDAVFRQ
jgi:hypothetical protein